MTLVDTSHCHKKEVHGGRDKRVPCSIEEKTKDYSETIANVLLTPRVQLTHKSNLNVGNCAGSEAATQEKWRDWLLQWNGRRASLDLIAIVWFIGNNSIWL